MERSDGCEECPAPLLPALRVKSAPEARDSSGQRPSRSGFRSWLLLSGVVLGLLQPRDLVRCQTRAANAAFEDQETGCCGPAGEGVVCVQGRIRATSSGLADNERAADKTCTDVFVEAHARLSRGLRFSRQQVAVLQFSRGPAPSPLLTRLTRADRGDAIRAVENELALSTVLRI